jgi:hypothetical protein
MIPDVPADSTADTLTHITAVGAIVSPLWLHHLSDAATMALPLLGCAWLILQAGIKVYTTFFRKPKV